MSFSFSQDLLAETGALTQPMAMSQDLHQDTQDLHLDSQDLQGDYWPSQESRSLLSQGDSGYSSQAWAAPPRRTLPRPPTFPRVRSSQELGPTMATSRETARSLGRSISRATQEVGARDLGLTRPPSQEAARWRLPTAPREEGQEQGKERDLRHHLSTITREVAGLPTAVSRLLEEAVRHLVACQEQGLGQLRGELGAATTALQGAAGARGEKGVKEQVEKVEKVVASVEKRLKRQNSATRDVADKQEELAGEVAEVRRELRRNSEVVAQLARQVEERRVDERRVEGRVVPGRRGPSTQVGRRLPRPLLTPAVTVVPLPRFTSTLAQSHAAQVKRVAAILNFDSE